MNKLKLESEFAPIKPQQVAIDNLYDNLNHTNDQILLGLTGTGKTFVIANVIEKYNKPTLILCPNKTLASQLYGEFKEFFPNNRVEYFISYFDYYRPESYNVVNDVYREKDSLINENIKKMRLSAINALTSNEPAIIIASISAIYASGNPNNYFENKVTIEVDTEFSRTTFLKKIVSILYSRVNRKDELLSSKFIVLGDTVILQRAENEQIYRISFFGDDIDSIEELDSEFNVIKQLNKLTIFPASAFISNNVDMEQITQSIELDLEERHQYFINNHRHEEATRIKERTLHDIDMLTELGYCTGIENYSAYFDGIYEDSRPYTLLDYFPDDFLLVMDESHLMVPQLKAVHKGYMSTKMNLIDYGFRLPSSAWTRPLTFDEYLDTKCKRIYVSATPGNHEKEMSNGVFSDICIRPTGLLEPTIDVRPTKNCIDDALEEIYQVIEKGNRILVNTLTKRMSEEVHRYLTRINIKNEYIHSDVDTLDRIKILKDYRLGNIDVIVGVNLLREGLDLPETELVIIFDADKEGFLRSDSALTQLVGRAARNMNGKAIMYGDKITGSMQRVINLTNERRTVQEQYNKEHNIVPKTIISKIGKNDDLIESLNDDKKDKQENDTLLNLIEYKKLSSAKKKSYIKYVKKEMDKCVKDLDFQYAIVLREHLKEIQ